MARRKRVVQAGQGNLLSGEIEGMEQLVNKPEVLEHEGLRVVKLVVPSGESQQYTETALEIARKLAPDIKSRERPPWLQQGWQVKRRKRQAGIE